ncbi:DAK2 domain-containing protein [Mitsuokella sp.]|uniref:DAK2 domain-containing protein n=1 Tax=Mitsuokella TaxID=52225 RepID=UPI0029DFE7E3|nr:DAK2 domain-containing protein [Mitsuokella sp.]MDD6383605.1 DAK2 domain-containing protein [Selenomonadaceae bacterium]MDY4474429.1 DAK2 domain-containing protein [Mitsuokella sp.]
MSVVDMTGNSEVITGSDFKRMVSGAYSEFLLEYEQINGLKGAGHLPGTHILRTMGAAVMPLAETKDDSIGGLSRRVATAAIFGARGSAGIVLAQMFRGLAKGLSGKYNATSSEFGKAFQYGILYAQRVVPEKPERPIITVAKAVAKGAYHAVRANLPITEILQAAIEAGEASLARVDHEDAGARIMFNFLSGCLKGLDGNFVSPAVSLSLGLEAGQPGLQDPREDLVRPYCVRFTVLNTRVDIPALERHLREHSSFALVERHEKGVEVHLHTDRVGKVIEQAVGWGPLKNLHVTNMSEVHVLNAHGALMKVALLAVAENKVQARELQEAGVHVIVNGSEDACPSVGELVNAAHSDLAASYVMISWSRDFRLAFQQAKRLLGERVELVLCENKMQQARAIKAFDPQKDAAANMQAMQQAREDA